MAKIISQSERVLQHMQRYGSITTIKAWNLYGITRLAARIKNLRDAGWDIESDELRGIDRYGRPTRFTRYTLRGTNND